MKNILFLAELTLTVGIQSSTNGIDWKDTNAFEDLKVKNDGAAHFFRSYISPSSAFTPPGTIAFNVVVYDGPVLPGITNVFSQATGIVFVSNSNEVYRTTINIK